MGYNVKSKVTKFVICGSVRKLEKKTLKKSVIVLLPLEATEAVGRL